jgi:hypothetical protein
MLERRFGYLGAGQHASYLMDPAALIEFFDAHARAPTHYFLLHEQVTHST